MADQGRDSTSEQDVGRLIHLRYAGTCCGCGAELDRGTQAWWESSTKQVTCTDCRNRATQNEANEAIQSDAPANGAKGSLPAPGPQAAPLDSGVAGGSARQTYERLHERREKQIERKWGRLAGVVKFLSDDPRTITVWAQGSKGEQILAEHMTKALGGRAVLLNDRTVPRTRGNIDHIVVAPGGVWVIDAKRWSGLVELRDVGGWFRTDQRLYVKGRDRTSTVRNMAWQVEAVRNALAGIEGDGAGLEVPVHAALCFVEAEWKFFSKPFVLEGVRVSGPKSLGVAIAEDGPLSRDEVLEVAAHLAEALPSKTG